MRQCTEHAEKQRNAGGKRRTDLLALCFLPRQTARTSRSEVVSVESARVSAELASAAADGSVDPASVGARLSAHLAEFEATLDREIDAQRRQLLQTLATNRAQKIEAQQRELRSKSQAYMQQSNEALAQQQQMQQQQQQQHSFSTISGSPSISAVGGASSQTSSSVFSTMHPAVAAERQRQEQQAESYARQVQEQEQQRAAFMQQQQLQQQPTASPAHRYTYNPTAASASKHSVTRVDHTPAHSPMLSPARGVEPQQQLQPQHQYVPASGPAAAATAAAGATKFTAGSPPRAVVSALKNEDPLRAQWMHLQAELHGSGGGDAHKPAAASALSAVSASSPSVGPQAATAANMTKLESALEMDWDSVWSEIETQKPSTQQHNGQGPSAQYAYHPPAATSHQQQRNGASRSMTSQSRSPSRDRPHALAQRGGAGHRTPLPSSTAAPVQVLQQASSLFKSTLHELEERAEYLHTLIAAFKDAGKEMDSTILQQSINLSSAMHAQQQAQMDRESEAQSQMDERRYREEQQQHEAEGEYEQQCEQQQPPPARSRSSHATQQPRRSLPPPQQRQQRSASRPRVAFAPAATPASRPRSASQAPTSRSSGSSSSALNRSASSVSVVSAAAAAPPARKTAPAATAPRRPASVSLARPAAVAPARPATAAAAAAPARRPSVAPVSTASSYPRPRTASARAARSTTDPGVAAAQARIRAILAKTRPARTRGVSAQTHPHVPRPRDVLLEEPRAKGGVRRASVQEVLQGAEDIAARKSQPVALRSKPGQQIPSSASAAHKRASLHKKDPADEYDFEPSFDAHPHHPLSLVAAAKMQAASTARLQTHAGVPSHAELAARVSYAAPPPASASASHAPPPHPDDEFGALMHEAEPSLLDDSLDGSGVGGGAGLNTTAGLIRQEAVAQARHGGQLEEYLKALSLPSHSEERRMALERLAAKSKQAPQAIYASPLRTHSAQAYHARAAAAALATAQGHGAERYNARANVIVRGSHSNDAPQPDKVQRVGGLAALQQVMNAHDVRVPVPQ